MSYYQETQPTYKVNVLGEEYSVYTDVPREQDSIFEHLDGYCDKTVRRIALAGKGEDCDLDDFTVYAKNNLRHELIHAFLFESGLDGNSSWDNGACDHPEQIVEWMALQFPKMLKAFQEVEAL